MRHVGKFVSPFAGPVPTRHRRDLAESAGRCIARCATTIPVHHVVPAKHPDHDYYVLSRHADVWSAARDHETFSSAQGLTVNYSELEMIGLQDNPPMVMQDPAGAHRVPQTGVARIHSAPGRGGGTQGARVRRRAHREAARQRRRRYRHRAVQAAAVDGRRALSRCAGGGSGPVRRLDRCDRRGQHRRRRRRRRTGNRRRCGRVDDGLLHRADRAPPNRARRTTPISHLVAAGVGADGDIAGTLSVLAFTFTMVTGGNDTTTGMLGGSMPSAAPAPRPTPAVWSTSRSCFPMRSTSCCD